MMNNHTALCTEPKLYPTGQGWVWIHTGFGIFKKGMGISAAMIVLWGAVELTLGLLPVVGSFVTLLLYMVWGAGWLAVARRGYEGSALQFTDIFAGFRHKLGPLILGGLLVLCLCCLAVLFWFLLLNLWGLEDLLLLDPNTLLVLLNPNVLTQVYTPVLDIVLCLLVLLALLTLLVPVLMAATFAPALIFFHDVGVWQAAKLSFRGCLYNMWPFLWWGLLAVVLLLFGTLLFLAGLLAVLPAINYSLYAAYRDIFLEEQEADTESPAKAFRAEAIEAYACQERFRSR